MTTPALDQLPFTIDNIPYVQLLNAAILGVISAKSDESPRCATAIGDSALDLSKYAESGNLSSLESGHNFSFAKVFAEVLPTTPLSENHSLTDG
ncbi:uncharacterized protein LTR77_003706 [Saxophila tyrrhenica]|uniref:Fumarylacetoacetase N-terminal domain-containing protein n=1 Tax=Saxophila tyrrhenica TaxID=1690608 RepID=A0AAV9PF42_9PEZI|nr:hypothetical protein LTR77_003706 [Saxophila tyrrhenica]